MAKPDSQNELTSTLHLGLRSVVGDSPSGLIQDFLAQATEQEREIVEGALSSDGKSAMVIIHRGPQKGARFLITSEGVTIGRSPENSIFLDDVTVSRKHAAIQPSTEGTQSSFIFKDSGSLNGSYINNDSVTEKNLVTGDEIQIGKYHLLFITAVKTADSTGEK
jgi:pSer/pThr/pTyr-binding forkhead associated (FHA) protein